MKTDEQIRELADQARNLVERAEQAANLGQPVKSLRLFKLSLEKQLEGVTADLERAEAWLAENPDENLG